MKINEKEAGNGPLKNNNGKVVSQSLKPVLPKNVNDCDFDRKNSFTFFWRI